jgi:hypothetical protein
MPDILKLRCIRAFQKIHARGVLHGDIELRHMLIGGDGKVTIIDFQESRATVPNMELKLESTCPRELRTEMRKVKFKLDFRGARLYEHVKRERELRRRRRNAELRRMRAIPSGVNDFPGYQPPLPEDVEDPPIGGAFQEYWCSPPLTDPNLRVTTVPGIPKDVVARAKREYVARIQESEAHFQKRIDEW